jgi:bifunctional non-homologous end joining protein LigD
MLWDRGTYEAEDGGGVESLREGYERGDLKIVLHGERLQGGWVLVRMKRPGRPQWLLIKHRDEFARVDLDVAKEITTSVTTNRTMDEIAEGVSSRSKRSKRPAPSRAAARRPRRSRLR